MGIVNAALSDIPDSETVVWAVVFDTGNKRVGRIKPIGDGMYAIVDIRPWYFHPSKVAMIAPEIVGLPTPAPESLPSRT